jgi:DNA polymerase I
MKLITIEEYEQSGKAHIALFTRDETGKHIDIISDFKPYFYHFSETPTLYKSINGDYVSKLEFDSYNVVKQERVKYFRNYEADCHFTQRFLVDKIDKIEQTKLRIQYTDIEKDIETNQTISIGVYDSFLSKGIVFVWRPDLQPHKEDKEYTFEKSGYKFKTTVHYYNTRKSMFQDYINFIQVTDPDILTGWFVVAYDFKEVLQEIQSLGLNCSDLSPIKKAYMIGDTVSKTESNIRIYGRILFDMLKAYRNLQPSRLESYSLENIAQKELDEGKHKHRKFTEIWNYIDELVEYNIKDCLLVKRLDDKKGLLNYYDEVRRFIGCSWDALFAESNMWDTYLMRKVHGKFVLPTKSKIFIPEYEGARVLQPLLKGIHKNVLVLDLKSLYPSIIMTANMGPDTLSQKGDDCNNLPNGISFKKSPIGILPESLLELLEMRKRFKKEMKMHPFGSPEYEALDHKQFTVKILMNSLYGIMGYGGFRLATPEVASSVTFVGRAIITHIYGFLEAKGYKMLYSDTDSVFFCGKGQTLGELKDEISSLVDAINVDLPVFIKEFCGSDNNYIKIEAKKIYKNLMISEKKSGKKGVTAKKRYAGLILWNEGEDIDTSSNEALDIVGFEQKRSDNSQLSRELQKKVFRMLLDGCETADLKAYISGVITSLSGNKFDYEYVGIPKGLSQSLEAYRTDNPHRRASIYSNKYLGGKFGIADKPKIIYVRGTGKYPKTDVIAFNQNEDIPKDFVMDVETMIDKSINQKLDHILDAAGLNLEELLHRTSKLSEFF